MSRSYRLPFYYYVCCGPIGRDRTRAARGVRRKHNQQLYKELRTQQSIDQDDARLTDFLLADTHECHWNNRWSWSCDASRPVLAEPTLSNRDLTDIGIYMNADPEGVSKVFGGRGRNNAHWLEYHLEDLGRRFQFWKKKQRK